VTDSTTPRILARAPIIFDVADGSSEHAPMIIGAVGGVVTRLVLDSGSEVHLLNRELVDEIGLASEAGEEGTDHSGATMPSWSVEDVRLGLGDANLTLRGVVAIPAPKPFPGWGVGGILSPQHLHPTAVAVIDLVVGELLLVEAVDAALYAWLAERYPDLEILVLPRDPAFPTPVVEAAIAPYAAIPTLLNTGGRGTEFAASAVPALAAGASTRIGGGVSGADVVAASAGRQKLLVGGRELPVASLEVRSTMHDPQGIVGMDVLRGTVLAVAADPARPVRWQLPPLSPA
jgi:hypothetical protein